jgi:hypothetical protein
MKYNLSGVTTESTWDDQVYYGTHTYGYSHNGALSSAHGAGSNDLDIRDTLNIGTSAGKRATSEVKATSGQTPGAGGGAGFGYPGLTTTFAGSAGGHGYLAIAITKGVINRAGYS